MAWALALPSGSHTRIPEASCNERREMLGAQTETDPTLTPDSRHRLSHSSG